ncbi:5-dehydro-4-deoxy-D-glucuronate isomerase [Cohnella endophytica]|uniref:4-deoxy-L-threo-5-hexosulose-uronate ketol-isomerase n=1 Tax=Cohnella endophytica TaxID=2419778 RepID=A0A494Y857_9BACL|nr:5-dehydro-4-deoxy-D-glucuronate isomerase [Cohnella endophytica]RKP56102.1 5-dehydro-4-deoxy-D-glucuronate isomerase [Cohnella endophytica]
MEIRHSSHPADVKQYDTAKLRQHFLIEGLFRDDKITTVYTHEDRVIIGGAIPLNKTLTLETEAALKTEYFIERREAGFMNIGGEATIEVDGERYELGKLDTLYVGKGARQIKLSSREAGNPAKIYFVSSLAHAVYPTRKVSVREANTMNLGSIETSNERTIHQIIHENGVQSCQLMMGVTLFKPGSVWNTMPAHLHDRRMEAYLYFDMKPDTRVFHFMGQPEETRHLVIANEQGVISPSWSIHSGAGTGSYAFIWAMAGENYTFKDMDVVGMDELK